MDFRWSDWNWDHVQEHGVDTAEAEDVVRNAGPLYPLHRGDGKWLVWGRGRGGRYLQVVFVLDPDGTVFIIHARRLTYAEKRRARRGSR